MWGIGGTGMANSLCRHALASCIGVVTVNNAHGASIAAAAIVLVDCWLGMAKGIIDAPNFLLHPSLRSLGPIYGISEGVKITITSDMDLVQRHCLPVVYLSTLKHKERDPNYC